MRHADRQIGSISGLLVALRDVGVARGLLWFRGNSASYAGCFEQQRLQNRALVEQGGSGDAELIEFDRYAQSSNDAYAVKIRLRTLLRFAFNRDITIEEL